MVFQRTPALLFVMMTVAAAAAFDVWAQPDATFVAIAPCRVLNTAIQPAAGEAEETARKVDVAATRCGRIIPPFATAYSVRVTNISREAPEKVPAGAGPVTEASRKIPITPGGVAFAIPGDRHIAVDVDGYYVPAGTPLRAAVTMASRPSGEVSTNLVHSGDQGELYLDGGASGYPNAGVAFTASAAKPWIVAKTGTATSASGFQIVNSQDQAIFTAHGQGHIKLPGNRASAFFDGATDFFGEPSSASYYPTVPMNTIHDVTLLNPLDAAGGSTSRIVFFNAETSDEVNSPPITKFRAFTLGFYAKENVNYDSVVSYHNPSQYHFRARSLKENNKDTFWVRAGTNGDSVTQTRADMFVSGRVGIGTAQPGHALDVSGAATIGAGYTSVATAPANGLLVEGNVGIGVPNPQYKLHVNGTIMATQVIGTQYQDLAEWVPATRDLEPGTVVVLDEEAPNTVRASATAYDTTVAGVVSAQPGLILGEGSSSKEMIATTGRVRVRVDATAAPVKIGDLLVTSGKPGVAMKSIPVEVGAVSMHRPGTIIGKALEPLASGEGEILVLLSLQ